MIIQIKVTASIRKGDRLAKDRKMWAIWLLAATALIVSNSYCAKLNDKDNGNVGDAIESLPDLDAAYNKRRFGRKGIVFFVIVFVTKKQFSNCLNFKLLMIS